MFGRKKHDDQAQVDQPQVDGYLPAHTQSGHPDPAPQMQAPAPSPVDAANSFIMTDAPAAPAAPAPQPVQPAPAPAIVAPPQPKPIQDFVSAPSFTPPAPMPSHSDDDHQHEEPASVQEESAGESIPVTHTPPAPQPEPTPEPEQEPAAEPELVIEPAPMPEPTPEPTPEPLPEATSPEPAPILAASSDLMILRQQALQQLSPIVNLLDQTAEEKFRTTMMMLQSTDDQGLVPVVYEAAQSIPDDRLRAQALLDVVNEINYFTQKNAQAQ